MRNVLTKVSKADADMVATWIRTIFTMGTPGAVRAQLDHVADTLAKSHPRVAEMLQEAKADVTAFSDFPLAHWRKIWSTNPLVGTAQQGGQAPHRWWESSRTPTPCSGSQPAS